MRFARMLSAVLVLLATGLASASAGSARLQVIHNSADPAAASVDVYVNGSLLLDNFGFRKATPFVDVPSGVPLTIGIAPSNSISSSDIIASFTVTLQAGKTYVAIANGVLAPSGFAPNPEGKATAFTLYSIDSGREKGRASYLVDLNVFHGATDAPSVNVLIRGYSWLPFVNNLSYGSFSSYKSVLPLSYTLDITPASDRNTVVASFQADLKSLGGGAAVVFASGFLAPEKNKDGAAFGLFAALPSGDVVELPRLGNARLQVIHNAADPAAASVDIYVNGTKAASGFGFRKATPFIDVPGGVPLTIGVAPAGSSSSADVIYNQAVTLTAGQSYVAIANGVLSPKDFAANPDGRDTGFKIFARGNAREKAVLPWFVDVLVFHGATDAPSVGIEISRGKLEYRIVNHLSYGAFSQYRTLLPKAYVLALALGGTEFPTEVYFRADLSGLAGKSAVVFASGFLNPSANKNGAAFGLFAALANGGVVELPALSTAAASSLAKEADLETATTTAPASFSLEQNYPNPFNPSTTIQYSVASPEFVTLKVYNSLGQEVATLVNEQKAAGTHAVTFNASSLASGTYIYRLTAGSLVQTRKLTLVK